MATFTEHVKVPASDRMAHTLSRIGHPCGNLHRAGLYENGLFSELGRPPARRWRPVEGSAYGDGSGVSGGRPAAVRTSSRSGASSRDA